MVGPTFGRTFMVLMILTVLMIKLMMNNVDDVNLPDLISLIAVLPSGALISNSGHVSGISMKSFNNGDHND